MEADSLKLTTYGGERHRVDGRFVADVLLDVYARHEVATSVLLRGALGFGLKHHLRTDRLLTLSEDLPVVSVAVDSRERIEALLPEVTAIKRHGLITLERARMLGGELTAVQLPEELHEATKLTVYLGRQEKVYGMPAHAAVCDLMYRHELAGASVFLGVDGTAHGGRERARFVGRNARVPMMLISVGSGETIARVLPELNALVRHPIVTLERVRVCKRDGERLADPHMLPGSDEHGMPIWQKLMIYASEQAKHDGQPIYQELVRRLRESGAAGATTLRGSWGFHGDHAPHGDRFFSLRRHVPTVTIVVDEPARIAAAFEIVDELTAEHGLVTSEMVPALASRAEDEQRGRLQLARHRF